MRPIAKIMVKAVKRKSAPGVIVLTIKGPLGGVIAGEAISIAEAEKLRQQLGAALAVLKGTEHENDEDAGHPANVEKGIRERH